MDTTRKNVIRQKCLEFVADFNAKSTNNKGGSAELVRQSGVNKGTISDITATDWATKCAAGVAQWNKLSLFFAEDIHFDTQNYKEFYMACQIAQIDSVRQAIDGYTGSGKTYALLKYKKENRGVYYMKGDRDKSRSDFLRDLAIQIGGNIDTDGNLSAIKREIVKALLNKENKCLLIFDEAEYYKEGIWFTIKSICDEIEHKVGVVICGVIEKDLRKRAKKETSGFAQILRRFEFKWIKASDLEATEIRKICEEYSITDANAVSWIVNRVDNYDSLATIIKETNIAAADGTAITANLLSKMYPNQPILAQKEGKNNENNKPLMR